MKPQTTDNAWLVGWAEVDDPTKRNALGAALLGAATFTAAAVLLFDPEDFLQIICLLIIHTFGLSTLAFPFGRTRKRAGELRIDAQGLTLAGQRIFHRSRIAWACAPEAGEPIVRIVLRGRTTINGYADLRLASEARARSLLDALGFRLDRSMTAYAAGPSRRLSLAIRVLIWAAVLASGILPLALRVHLVSLPPESGMHAAGWLLAILATAAALSSMAFRQVEVGGDGVLLRRISGNRFVPYDRLTSMLARGPWVTLEQDARTRFQFHAKDAADVADRIEAARLAFSAAPDSRATAASLARGNRTLADWVRDLRTLRDAHHYRTPLGPSVLWRIVEDPTGPASARAAAAFALVSAQDYESRIRIDSTARSCANPRLRTALERLAESEGEESVAGAVLSSLSSE